jgi:hypothetical protein
MRLDDEFAALIETEDIDNEKKSKAVSYQYESIPRSAVDDYRIKGWEIQKEFKTKVRMRKKKVVVTFLKIEFGL